MTAAQIIAGGPRDMKPAAPRVFRVRTEEDLDRIPFENGMAAVEVPAHLIDKLHLKNDERGDSLRLRALERSIRDRGFQTVEPITARIGRKGRWVVVDGGHRLTAARHVMREFWANLFGQRVKNFYFILFTNPDSWSTVGVPEGVEVHQNTAEEATESQTKWEEARARMKREG